MAKSFDEACGHRHFSAACFNRTWEYLDKSERSAAETEVMLHSAHASLWHWLQRGDATWQNRSVGYWMLARVYAEAGRGEVALHYGGISVEEAEAGNLAPFYLGYAFEAIARAYKTLGRSHDQATWKTRAAEELAKVHEESERKLLAADLDSL